LVDFKIIFNLAIGRLCEKCDGKCVICDSYVRPSTLVRICDECNYGSYQGRCVICGGPGISDAYYCRECTILEKDVRFVSPRKFFPLSINNFHLSEMVVQRLSIWEVLKLICIMRGKNMALKRQNNIRYLERIILISVFLIVNKIQEKKSIFIYSLNKITIKILYFFGWIIIIGSFLEFSI